MKTKIALAGLLLVGSASYSFATDSQESEKRLARAQEKLYQAVNESLPEQGRSRLDLVMEAYLQGGDPIAAVGKQNPASHSPMALALSQAGTPRFDPEMILFLKTLSVLKGTNLSVEDKKKRESLRHTIELAQSVQAIDELAKSYQAVIKTAVANYEREVLSIESTLSDLRRASSRPKGENAQTPDGSMRAKGVEFALREKNEKLKLWKQIQAIPNQAESVRFEYRKLVQDLESQVRKEADRVDSAQSAVHRIEFEIEEVLRSQSNSRGDVMVYDSRLKRLNPILRNVESELSNARAKLRDAEAKVEWAQVQQSRYEIEALNELLVQANYLLSSNMIGNEMDESLELIANAKSLRQNVVKSRILVNAMVDSPLMNFDTVIHLVSDSRGKSVAYIVGVERFEDFVQDNRDRIQSGEYQVEERTFGVRALEDGSVIAVPDPRSLK